MQHIEGDETGFFWRISVVFWPQQGHRWDVDAGQRRNS
jgi:hypothetical protein